MHSRTNEIVCDDMSSTQPVEVNNTLKKRNWFFFTTFYVIPLCIVIACIAYIFYESTSIQNVAPKNNYGITLDAGSTGTRLHLFQWMKKKYDPDAQVKTFTQPYQVYFYNYKRSLSDCPLEDIDEILRFLIEHAKDVLMTNVHITNIKHLESFPLYVQATGGMRKLDSYERNLRMSVIRSLLSNKKFNPFQFYHDYARVISGEEEGIYGWISVNSFLNSDFGEADKTYGAVELGGSSVQLSFFPIGTSVLENFNELHLNNSLVRLYSHSFVGYGWKDSFFRSCVLLILKQMKNISLGKTLSGKEEKREEKEKTEKEEPYITDTDRKKYEQKKFPEQINNFAIIDELLHKEFIKYVNEKNNYNNSNMGINHSDVEFKKKRSEHTIPEYENNTHKYTYNINTNRPYYVEKFIKKIKNFRRNGNHDTIMVVQNPCLPFPIKMEIVLPAFNLEKEEFVIVEKRSNPGRDEKTFYDDIQEFVETEDVYYKEQHGMYVLAKKTIDPHTSLWEQLFFDFKLSNHFKNVLESELFTSMNDTDKEELLKYIFKNYTIRRNKDVYINITIEMIGSNNFSECLKITNQLFYKESCFLSSCSFNGVYQPRLKGNKFVVHGLYRNVMTRLGFENKINLQTMKERVEKYCNLNFMELKNHFEKLSVSMLKQFCWKTIWSYALLFYGFKFTNESELIILNDHRNLEDEDSDVVSENFDTVDYKSYSTVVENHESDTENQKIDEQNIKPDSFFYKRVETFEEESKENQEIKTPVKQRMRKYNVGNEDSVNTEARHMETIHMQSDTNSINIMEFDKPYGVSWTQGSIIYQVNFLPAYVDLGKIQMRWSLLLALCVIFIMAIVMLIGYTIELTNKLHFYTTPQE